MTRQGTSLVEALVACLLTAALAVASLSTIASLQRVLGRVAQRSASAQTLRGTAQLIRSELRGVSPAAGDLLSLAPAAITYRAVRATGLACGLAPGRLSVSLSSWAALRQPASGRDSLLLLAQPDGVDRVAAVTGGPMSGNCINGVASMSFSYGVGPSDPLVGAHLPAPVIVTENMELRSYLSTGAWWIGVRSISAGETIQPAFGPIAPTGLQVTGYDSTGSATADVRRVRRLEFLVWTPPGDSLSFAIDLSDTWR